MNVANNHKNDIIIKKINNINCDYDSAVNAFKLLLKYTCDDEYSEQLKKLGNQIIDSFLLLTLLNNHSNLKKYIKSYENLTKSLYDTVNKYLKFEKILRNKNFNTQIFFSNKDEFNHENINYVNEIEEASNIEDSSYIYIVLSDNEKAFSLNSILNATNLFRVILCKDSEKKFKKNIFNSRNKIDISVETQDLMNKKNLILGTLSSDTILSDKQYISIQSIIEKSKEILKKEIIISNLNDLKLSIQDFCLEPSVEKLFNVFIEECVTSYREISAEFELQIHDLKEEFKLYENEYCIIENENKVLLHTIIVPENLKTIRNVYYQLYLDAQKKGILSGKSFSSYLMEFDLVSKELIEIEKLREEQYNLMMSKYIIYKAPYNGTDLAITFEEYIKKFYNIEIELSEDFKNELFSINTTK